MTDTLVVALAGERAGVLVGTGRGLRFEYDDAYRTRPDATPLSVSMPLAERVHVDRVVAPWLWGLLPENADVLGRWARRFQVSLASPFPLLTTPVGHDCAGAVQFAAPDEVDDVVGRPGRVEWLTDDQVAGRLRALRRDATVWLGPDFSGQFSLAGAQAKTALHGDGRRWGVAVGSTPTTTSSSPPSQVSTTTS